MCMVVCVCTRVNDLGEFVDGFGFEQEDTYVNRVCRWTDWERQVFLGGGGEGHGMYKGGRGEGVGYLGR